MRLFVFVIPYYGLSLKWLSLHAMVSQPFLCLYHNPHFHGFRQVPNNTKPVIELAPLPYNFALEAMLNVSFGETASA